MPALLADMPSWFWDVPYVGERYPGACGCRSELRTGGDCQLFAYEVLAHFGHYIPDSRSDELWRDTTWTDIAGSPQPLDLVLFHNREEAYGAHVGLVCGQEEVVHLSKELGRPALWPFAQFAATPRFATLIGFKRPMRFCGEL